jgi:hypothetical protein
MEAVNRLEQSMLEAITLQSRLGRPPSELVQILVSLTGDRPRVDNRLKAVAGEPGIEQNVREWLLFGGKAGPARFASEHATEAGLRDADAMVAAAAIRSERIRRRLDAVNEVLPAIRAREDLAHEAIKITQLLNDVRALIGDLTSLLRRRSLHFFGEHGEIVPADRLRHEKEDGGIIDTAMVKVRSPGVLRRTASGSEAIVVKAVVEGVTAYDDER